MTNTNENKQRFINLLKEVSEQRKGVDKLLTWLDGTDFFTAPASTRFHGAYEGGLVEHSLNVYDAFMKLFGEDGHNPASVTLCTLLHDICKSGFYKTEMRNRKNEQGQWEQVPVYTVEDRFPMGHGEKSVWLIERFVRLTAEESIAIRWHMGGFDESVRGGSYALSAAYEEYPLAVKLNMAYMYASYILETRGTENQ